ncbi:MAG: hypothetical protein NC419_07130 [Muribaculaceae bacterium]|nr:hypothetical protein [Muribaculaceae bacterium]
MEKSVQNDSLTYKITTIVARILRCPQYSVTPFLDASKGISYNIAKARYRFQSIYDTRLF